MRNASPPSIKMPYIECTMEDTDTLRKAAFDVYSLCLISLVLSPLAFVPALVIIARYLRRSRGTRVRSHLSYALASMGLYVLVLGAVIMGWRWTAAQQFFTVQHNIFPPLFLYPALVVAPIAWWIWRLQRGYRLLQNDQAIANPWTLGKVYAQQFT